MKDVTIIDKGAILPDKDAERFSDKVIEIIKQALTGRGYQPAWELYASQSVYQLIQDNAFDADRTLRDVALMIYHSDWKSIQERLKRLIIYVEGCCPKCGEELELVGGHIRHDWAMGCIVSDTPDYNRCPKCNYVEE